MMKVYPRYINATFDNYTGDCEVKNMLIDVTKLHNNVVIWGGVGVGKTHLAYSILNKECEIRRLPNGYEYYKSDYILYTSVKELIDEIKISWANKDNSYLGIFGKIKILIIDEVGVQYGSDSERIELFNIFNERYNNCLPTIILSNYSPESIKNILGLRIYDRLFGGAKVFELKGKSHRQ